MPKTPATTVLDREFLGVRSRLIDLAAALDRIERSDDGAVDDPRREQIRRSIEILCGNDSNRAERVELEFSLPYENDWPERP